MNNIRKNNVIIDNNKVIKKRNDKLIELYDYLDSKGFSNHPKILDVKDDTIESEFINKTKYNELVRGSEFVKTIASLHLKTTEYKTVSKNKYKKIYDTILGNINFLKNYYEKMISNIEKEVFMSPSHYLFSRNYSIINSSLNNSEELLKKWYKMVENNSKERVCIVHNNLSLNHYIKGDKDYLISFDNYLVDTPILDLYKFYIKEGHKLEFKELLIKYEEVFKLLDYEKDLLYTLIQIPPKIEELEDEYDNCNNIRSFLDYIYSSIINTH